MRFNLNVPVVGYNGKNLQTNPDKDGKTSDVILRDVVVNVINAERPDSKTEPNAKDKATVFRISNQLYQNNRVHLSVSDIDFILKKAEANAVPLIYGRLKEILDPDPEPENDEAEPKSDE